MPKKIKTIIVSAIIVFIVSFSLTACNSPNNQDTNQNQLSEQKLTEIYQKTIGDNKSGYTVEAFIEQEPIPKEIDKIITLLPMGGNYEGIGIHRSLDQGIDKKTDYLKIFNMKHYPFYIIVGQKTILLKTYSVNKVTDYMLKHQQK